MLDIPFYKNTRDDLHCLQACLKSILKFYFPSKTYSFAYLDRVTKHKPGKGTWDSAMLLYLARLGFHITYILTFDYRKFAALGEKYLESFWTDEIYQAQKQYSDFKAEQKLAKKLVEQNTFIIKKRAATMQALISLFSKENIIMTPINPYVLNHQGGYYSHIVLITDIKKNTIIFHDPGLPGHKNREEPIKLFFKAMCYPSRSSASLIAVKLK